MTPHDAVERYYSDKLRLHGPGPRGVDWPSVASQYLRFAQLLRVCDFGTPFSLIDFGCGCGGLLSYLDYQHPGAPVDYVGIDVSAAMIAAARRAWIARPHTSFDVGSCCTHVADYAVASGIFNIRLGWPSAAWETYVESILSDMARHTRRGFAVNFMRPDGANDTALYRVEPERWTRFVTTQLGCRWQLLDDYGLAEFTLTARHQ